MKIPFAQLTSDLKNCDLALKKRKVMRICPKCGETNGNNLTKCFKCGANLGSVDSYKKICPNCGLVYGPKSETCEECGERLSVVADRPAVSFQQKPASKDYMDTWLYVVAILFPVVGILLGCAYIIRHDDFVGKRMIILSLVFMVLWGILLWVLSSCAAGAAASHLGRSLY